MNKMLIAMVALAASIGLASPALADPGNVGNGNGNCGVGQGNGGPADCDHGNGGAGGAGGSAAQQQGQLQGQAQGQIQGQLQGQAQGQVAVGIGQGGNATVGNTTSDSRSTANANNDSHNAAASQGNTTTVTGDTVTYDAKRIPVATAWAAPLTSGNDVCMGSVSAGAQGAIIGLSFAKTYTDEHCVNLKLARELKNEGFGVEACHLMIATEPKVAEAFRRSGRTCETATIAVPVETGANVPSPSTVVQPVVQPVVLPFTGERG